MTAFGASSMVLQMCEFTASGLPLLDPCRAEFRVWHDKAETYYIMFEKVCGLHSWPASCTHCAQGLQHCTVFCSYPHRMFHEFSMVSGAAVQVEGEKKPRQVRVDHFPRGSMLMNQLMGILMTEVARVPVLKHRLYQANFHTTLSGEAMVCCALASDPVCLQPDGGAGHTVPKVYSYLTAASDCRTKETSQFLDDSLEYS